MSPNIHPRVGKFNFDGEIGIAWEPWHNPPMDDKLRIMHLYLAIAGGALIVAVGLFSFVRFQHFPVLSFTVGPLISIAAWTSLRDFKRVRRRF
jgi:hypothetical protein